MLKFNEDLHRSKVTKYRKKRAAELNGTILDCGGGLGCYLPFFQGKVVVLDRNQQALELLDYHSKVIADAENLPFADNSFDNVWACAVCQYLNLDGFVREAKRITRAGGHVLILVPNANSPWDIIKKLLGMGTWWDQEGIVKQYSVRELKQFGKVTGEIQFLPFEKLLRNWTYLGHTLMLEIIKEENK